MRLYPLAYLAGLLPLMCIHITYWLSASHGQVPWCFPYIESCSSISATGREPPAFFVFKGIMIPAAVLLIGYWTINARWLKELGNQRIRWQRTIQVLGLLAGGGLIFYSLLLGSIGAEYRQLRHTGVLAFFGFTFFAQLTITWLLSETVAIKNNHPGLLRVLQLLMATDLLVGLANVLFGFIDPAFYDTINNAFAWNFTLLLCIHVLFSAELWRRTGLQMSLTLHRY